MGRAWSLPCLLAAGALYCAAAAPAQAAPIDLNDFFADPPVTVAADGSSASFVEDLGFFTVLLENDPGLGDPNVILPAPLTILSFDFSFVEGPGNDDEFLAILFDSGIGGAADPLAELASFFTGDTSAGTVEFDLSPHVGKTLGLSFQFSAFDLDLDSTLTISNLRTEVIPEPGTLALFASAGIAAILARRRRRSAQG